WLLTGASAIPGRHATSSRYQLTDGVLLIVLAAELLRGPDVRGRAVWLLGMLTVVSVGSNLLLLRHGYDFLRVESMYAKADLGALEIARPVAPPNLWLVPVV